MDSDKAYRQAQGQLQLHGSNPDVYSPTSGDAQKARGLARRYAESYEAIAKLFDQLDEEQQRAHQEWKGSK